MTEDDRDADPFSDDRATDLVLLAVPLCYEALDMIDQAVEREERRTGDEHSRQEFVRSAVLDRLDRLSGDKWRVGETAADWLKYLDVGREDDSDADV